MMILHCFSMLLQVLRGFRIHDDAKIIHTPPKTNVSYPLFKGSHLESGSFLSILSFGSPKRTPPKFSQTFEDPTFLPRSFWACSSARLFSSKVRRHRSISSCRRKTGGFAPKTMAGVYPPFSRKSVSQHGLFGSRCPGFHGRFLQKNHGSQNPHSWSRTVFAKPYLG